MTQEYDLMYQGRIARHAYIVEPTGQAGLKSLPAIQVLVHQVVFPLVWVSDHGH